MYTALLFAWQWILCAPNYKWLKWIRNTRLNLFMEANLAPYKSNYRYWTGLLLLIRVALYLEIAYNNSYESSTSVLVTGLIAAGLLLLKVWAGGIYKKKTIDYLDSFCYFNLLTLSVVQLYLQAIDSKQQQKFAVKTSVSITFLLLLCVFIVHVINTSLEIPFLRAMKTSLMYRLQNYREIPIRSQGNNLNLQVMLTSVTPTSTEVGLSQLVTTEESALETGEETKTTVEKLLLNQQSCKTNWECRNSLREPLLQ